MRGNVSNDRKNERRLTHRTVGGRWVERLETRRLLASIASGQTINGNQKIVGQLDTYTFSVTSGHTFVFAAGATSGSGLHPALKVFAPDGTIVFDDYTSGGGLSAAYTVPAGKGGRFVAVVGDAYRTAGAYDAELVVGPSVLSPTGDGRTIGKGQTISAAVAHTGDIDGYTFTATAGDSFVISAAAGSALRPSMKLIAPDGAFIFDDYTSGPAISFTYTIPAGKSGTYTAVVGDAYSTAGAYQIALSGNIRSVTPKVSVTAPAAQTAGAGVSHTFALGKFSSAYATGPHTVLVDWGDGSAKTSFVMAATGTITPQDHTYAKNGSFTPIVTVTDSQGLTGSATFVVTVGAAVDNASIAGVVFNDADGDGVKDSAELGLGLWQVYLHANKNGKLDPGGTAATTDINGLWSFTGLAAGTYVVRIVQVSKTATTTAGSLTITLAAGQAAAGRLFGEKQIA